MHKARLGKSYATSTAFWSHFSVGTRRAKKQDTGPAKPNGIKVEKTPAAQCNSSGDAESDAVSEHSDVEVSLAGEAIEAPKELAVNDNALHAVQVDPDTELASPAAQIWIVAGLETYSTSLVDIDGQLRQLNSISGQSFDQAAKQVASNHVKVAIDQLPVAFGMQPDALRQWFLNTSASADMSSKLRAFLEKELNALGHGPKAVAWLYDQIMAAGSTCLVNCASGMDRRKGYLERTVKEVGECIDSVGPGQRDGLVSGFAKHSDANQRIAAISQQLKAPSLGHGLAPMRVSGMDGSEAGTVDEYKVQLRKLKDAWSIDLPKSNGGGADPLIDRESLEKLEEHIRWWEECLLARHSFLTTTAVKNLVDQAGGDWARFRMGVSNLLQQPPRDSAFATTHLDIVLQQLLILGKMHEFRGYSEIHRSHVDAVIAFMESDLNAGMDDQARLDLVKSIIPGLVTPTPAAPTKQPPKAPVVQPPSVLTDRQRTKIQKVSKTHPRQRLITQAVGDQ